MQSCIFHHVNWLLIAISSLACFGKSLEFPTGPVGESFVVELQTPGGPLPFELHLFHGARYGPDLVTIVNGFEENTLQADARVLRLVQRHDGFTVRFLQYDSELRFVGPLTSDHRVAWEKLRGESVAEMEGTAHRNRKERFLPIQSDAPSDFSGRWSVNFSSSDDLAIGVFDVADNQLATGTFLTTTGDYRYLAGRVDGDLMRLSTFDGAHAFLFHARMQDDGTIEGDFWSGNWWHETWTAKRDPDAKLPDMFEQTTVADADALDDLVFKALDGSPTKVADLLDTTDAPARVLYIFGTWCPNCADAAAELKRLKDLHGDDLGVVGLAFELTDDHKRSATQVNRYLERHGGTWPILIAGLSDKSKASAELPILDKVRSYPTTIFLNANNEIVSVHTGFTGPATGEAFSDQQREYERIIKELISEQP